MVIRGALVDADPDTDTDGDGDGREWTGKGTEGCCVNFGLFIFLWKVFPRTWTSTRLCLIGPNKTINLRYFGTNLVTPSYCKLSSPKRATRCYIVRILRAYSGSNTPP